MGDEKGDTSQTGSGDNSVNVQLEKQIEYYRGRYAELESKVNEIWSQREAYRLASERITDNMVKREMGSKSSRTYRPKDYYDDDYDETSDADDYDEENGVYKPVLPHATSVSFKVAQKPKSETARVGTSKFAVKEKHPYMDLIQQRKALEMLMNNGKKLYAFKVLNPEIKSSVPLFLDAAIANTNHGGNILVSERVGLFKISKVPPVCGQGVWNKVGQSVLGLLGMSENNTNFTNVLDSFADYTGLRWFSKEQGHNTVTGSQTCRAPSSKVNPQESGVSHPYCQIRYIDTLERGQGNKMKVAADTYTKDCNVACMFNGRWDTLACVEGTQTIDQKELYGHPGFTFVLETQISKRNKEAKSKRYSNQLHLIHSGTGQYLCIDLLTRQVSFTMARSRYVAPALFKMVPLYNLLVDSLTSDATRVNVGVQSDGPSTPQVLNIERATNSSRRMVDCYGNFTPISAAHDTPAPSPKDKQCRLLTSTRTGLAGGGNVSLIKSFQGCQLGPKSTPTSGALLKQQEEENTPAIGGEVFKCVQYDVRDSVRNLKMRFERPVIN